MARRDDGLMLSLSLGFPENDRYAPSPLDLFRSTLPVFTQQNPNTGRLRSDDAFQFFTDGTNTNPRSLIGGIDVAPTASTTRLNKADEEALMSSSSPNSTLSSASGKRTSSDRGREHEYRERAPSSSDEEGGGDMSARKKLRLCKEQSVVLEEAFREHNTLNPKQKAALSKQLNMKPRQVEVWFQNRRARTKLKQTEVDCEYLRRCFEDLNDENRRLQRELSQLRTLKLSPAIHTNMMNPPTTLTMCPQCEHVNVSSSKVTSSLALTTDNWQIMPLQLMGFNDSASTR